MQDDWQKTQQYARVNLRTIYTSSWRQVVVPREWPADLRPVLEEFLASPERWISVEDRRAYQGMEIYGSPRFYIAVDGKLVYTDVGLNGWHYGVAPKLKELVGV